MSVNDESAVSRQFVASPPTASVKMYEAMTGKRKAIFYVVYTLVAAAIFALTMVRPLKPWMAWGLGAFIAVAVMVFLLWMPYLWWRSRRKIVVGVTAGGLTVNERPGTVFAIDDLHLGAWARMGVAIHLQSGSRRFVLGGRDRRIAPSTRLDAPPVAAVDAWLWDSDFDELLAVGARGVVARGPALGEPTRCLLFPNPFLAEEFGSLGFRKHLRHQNSLSQPNVILDVDNDAIRVSDANGDALNASAWRSQVTATPAIFQPGSVTSGDGSTYDYQAVTGLVVDLPGVPPLTIGCIDMVGSQLRFLWQGNVPRRVERPAHVISGGDWSALAEVFGLTPHLQDGLSR